MPVNTNLKEQGSAFFSVGREFYDDDYSDRDDSSCGQLDLSCSIASLRPESLKSLQDAYQNLTVKGDGSSKLHKKAMCWICGASGTGKSTLFQQFIESLPEKPLVLRGKYEEEKSGDAHPLSALLDAFSGLGSVNSITQAEREALRKNIIQHLGQDGIATISAVIPKLGKLVATKEAHCSSKHANGGSQGSFVNHSGEFSVLSQSSQDTSSTTNPIQGGDSGMAINRLKYMFQAVTLAISELRPGRPTVLMLDDIQWTDKASLQVLEVLLMDEAIANFMFVGCCRSEDATQDLLQTMETIHNAGESYYILVKNIEIGNLSMEGVTHYLNTVFRIDADETDSEEAGRVHEFATVLHNMAGGNIFFMQQILAELNGKGSLTFSHITFRWEWDLQQIHVADTVVQAITDRVLRNCSKLQLEILKTAAYMRHSFDADSLLAVMQVDDSADGQRVTREVIREELDKAVAKKLLSHGTYGFMSESTKNVYCFAHDKIQQAVYEMVAEGPTRRRFCHAIGSRLYKLWSNDKGKDFGTCDWMLYTAVDHYNASSCFEDHDKDCKGRGESTDTAFLAFINLETGKKCMDVAAFENASKYLGVALRCLRLLSSPAWSAHYDLTLDVYCTAADVALINGNMEEGKALVEQVIKNARRLEDMHPAQLALAKAIGNTNHHEEAFLMARQALQDAGVYAKTSLGVKLALARDLLFVRRYFRTHSDDEILSLPVLNDMRLNTLMELIRTASYFALWRGNNVEAFATALKSIRMTLREGLLAPSGTSFMTYSMILDNIGDKNALRFANLSLEIIARTGQSKFCLLYSMKSQFFDSWSTDIMKVKAQYDKAYKSGLACGDFQNAMLALNYGVTHLFFGGYPLAMLDLLYADITRKEEMYRLSFAKELTRVDWTTVQQLRGTTGAPLDIQGMLPTIENVQGRLQQIYFATYIQLAVYFGEYHVFQKIVKMNPRIDKSHYALGIGLAFQTIVYATLFQRTGKRVYRRKGKAFLAELKAASLTRGMNSWHRYSIARAHLQACTKLRLSNPPAALEDYEKSIKLASERNHKQDVGLAAQLAAECLLWADANKYACDIKRYMTLALQSYRDWGASNLVQHLQNKYTACLGD